MNTNILEFPHKTPPVERLAQFVRIGETNYQRVCSLFTEGHLKASRVVVDASRIRFLEQPIAAFRDANVELVLDTKAAELAAVARFSGNPKNAPWSQIADGGPIGPDYFSIGHPADIFGQIARCAVQYGLDTVLSTGHFIGDKNFDDWLNVDRAGCSLLRHALDREGGKHIAIDYLLIVPHLWLNDPEKRLAAIAGLSDLPFDNLWVRVSGFGNDSGAGPVASFISSLTNLHNLGKPIITDYLGGLIGEAVMALGASSGCCHGIGESERFDARQWHTPPKPRDENKPGGRAKRVSLAGLNRSLTVNEFETLCSAKGGKRLLLPQDKKFGQRGSIDVTADPKVVAAIDATSNFDDLSNTPNAHRAQHFLQHRMEPVVQLAMQVKNLIPNVEVARRKGVSVDKLMARMSKHSEATKRQSNSLAHLQATLKDTGSLARPVQRLSPLEERARGGQR